MESHKKIKVSVIVPIYNAGDKLKRCLDSIINQTLQEIEIILVLDCPSDGSDGVAKEYSLKDNRIIIIENKANIHIGWSRNKGIEIAKGEYIHFSDHDDYRELSMLEEMYNKATNEDLDMLISTPVSIKDGGLKIYDTEKESRDREYILRHLLRGGYSDEKHPWSYYCYIHNILYRRKMIDSSNIKFVDTRETTPEDVIFNIECIINSNKVGEVKKIYYYHELFEKSEGHKSSYFAGLKRIEGYSHINEILLRTNLLDVYKEDFYSNVAKNYVLLLFRAIECNHSLTEFFRCIKKYRDLYYTKEVFCKYKTFLNSNYTGIKYLILRCILFMILCFRDNSKKIK